MASWVGASVFVCILASFLPNFGISAVELKLPDVSGAELATKIEQVDYIVVVLCKKITDRACDIAAFDLSVIKPEHTNYPDLEMVVTDSSAFAEDHAIDSFPAIMFFRRGRPTIFAEDMETFHTDWKVKVIKVKEVIEWLNESKDTYTNVLTDENFEHDTQVSTGGTSGDWYVMFYKPECSQFLASWEALSQRCRHERPMASVDLTLNPKIYERFQFTECLNFALFVEGYMYKYDGPLNINGLHKFAHIGYQEAASHNIPADGSTVLSVAIWILIGCVLTVVVVFGALFAMKKREKSHKYL